MEENKLNLVGKKVITLPFHVGNIFLPQEDRENYPFIYTKEMEENEGKVADVILQEVDRVLVAIPSGVFWYPYESIQLATEFAPIHLLKVEEEYLYFDFSFVKGDCVSYEMLSQQILVESDSEKTEFGWKCKYRILNSENFPINGLKRGERYKLISRLIQGEQGTLITQ